jgi:hypothetical protein
MRYELKSVDVLSASKMAAVLYFCLTLAIFVPMGIVMTAVMPHKEAVSPFFGLGMGVFMLIMPFVYAGMGFVFSALACFAYNLLAKWMGGVSFEFETKA